jgi:S1-C subfamily serine protease
MTKGGSLIGQNFEEFLLRQSIRKLAFASTLALAESLPAPPANLPKEMLVKGAPLKTPLSVAAPMLAGSDANIPTAQLLHIAEQPARNMIAATRSAKDAEIYRIISPSVVLVATKDGLGSGSLVDSSGDIVTNWHVVRGYDFVAVVYSSHPLKALNREART